MKRSTITWMTVLCMMIMASAAFAAGPVMIMLAHDLPEDTPQHMGCVKFKETVEAASGGQFKISIFPKGTLGNDLESIKLLQGGKIQASLIPTAKLSSYDAALQIVDLPFLFPSKKVCYCVLDSDVGARLLAGLEKNGLKGVAFWESGFKQLTADRPIHKPEDYKGLKIRVMNSPILMEQFKIMGANSLPIPFPDVYSALKNKVVNGQENPLVSITKMKFFEVQSHMTLSYHGYLGYAFLFSKSFWDMLTDEQKEILQNAALKTAAYERKLTADMEDGFLKTIADSGTTIIRLSDDERKAFEAATRPVHEEFADKVGRETLEMVYKKIGECSSK